VGAETSSVLGPEQARGRVESGSLDEGRSFLMQYTTIRDKRNNEIKLAKTVMR